MRDFHPERADPRGVALSLRQLGRYVDGEHYRRWVGANAFSLGSGPPTRGVIASMTPTIDFADAVTQDTHAVIERPEFWTDGQIELRLYYTVTATAAGNFFIRPAVTPRELGEDLSTAGAGAVNNESIPSGTANFLLAWDMPTLCPVTAGQELLTVRVRRLGGHANDTAATVLQLVGALLTYHPNRSEEL